MDLTKNEHGQYMVVIIREKDELYMRGLDLRG